MDIVTIDTKGGLGNQLFQIMTAVSYGIDFKKTLVLQWKSESPSVLQNRATYWDTVFRDITTREGEIPAGATYKEKRFSFDEIPDLSGSVLLDGYFQSYRYFDRHRDETLKTLWFDRNKGGALLNQYRSGDKPLVGLHFRRGDYKQLKNFHNIMGMNYYQRAFGHFMDATFLVFCEESDKAEIQLDLEKMHTTPEYRFSDNSIDDHTQMYMMSLCDHNIISNSSYSWWGAYMNNNPHKVVIAPAQWFGPANQMHQTVDLIPESWVRL